VIAGALVFAVVYSLLAWLRYRTFIYGGRFDLGNMVQAVYNTAHGQFLQNTTADMAATQASRLGSHADPILAFFAVPWLVWPSPAMLLCLQAAIVSTAAWPAYRLATRWFDDARVGVLLAWTLLLYPALGFVVLDEFHPVALAIPLLLFAFLFIEEDRWRAAIPFLIMAAACKENVSLAIAASGLYFALRKRDWHPLLLTVAGFGYFCFALWIVIPQYTSGQTPFVDRYAALGGDSGAMLKHLVLRPWVLADGLAQLSNLEYWRALLWPVLYMPVLSPLTLLIAAPEFILNALSSKASQRSVQLHYTAVEIPFLFAAAALGLARLRRWLAGKRPRISGLPFAFALLVTCLAANYVIGPLPLPLPGSAYDVGDYGRSEHAAVIDRAIRQVPDGVTVSVSNNVGSGLSARSRVLTFPAYDGAGYVVLDGDKPDVFDRYDPPAFKAALRRLSQDPSYILVFRQDGVMVYARIPVPAGSRDPTERAQ
jgi:uncharacterized membrane protein